MRRSASITEHSLQVTVVAWAMALSGRFPELASLFAVPNGGKRSRIVGALLKAEGVRAGVPDLCLPAPRCSYAALYLELKIPGNKPTASQCQMARLLLANGNAVVWADSFEGAIGWLHMYCARDEAFDYMMRHVVWPEDIWGIGVA